jgi:hypothetical protein
MRLRALLPALFLATCFPLALAAAPRSGKVAGIVVAQGTPQLGATVVVTPQDRPGQALRLLTDRHGAFNSHALPPGDYSVRVRLAGFLPAFESRVLVTAGQITLLRIQLGSLFSSVERLRQGPPDSRNPNEWKWVLRSASMTRPVLRFSHGHIVLGGEGKHARHPFHGRAELTTGTLAPWSPANPQAVGVSSFFYDQGLGSGSQLLIRGRVGYDHVAASAVAATWLHSSDAGAATTDSTTIVFNESQFGAEGPSFRGVEINSLRKTKWGDRIEIEYGGQMVLASMSGSVSSARPVAQLQYTIDPAWTASFLVASSPLTQATADSSGALDGFATPVENNGRLALDRPWHEEISLNHRMKGRGSISAAFFRDSDANTALFGRGPLLDANTIADPYSDAFVYDGGALNQWGARLGYQKKLSSDWQAALAYSWSRTLAPADSDLSAATLRDMIQGQRRDAIGGRVTGRLNRTGTELSAGYQWVDGAILIRPDAFGDALFGIDPYLNVSVRQPLPNFLCCRIVAIVDVRNLLAQGYVNLNTAGGRAVVMPDARAIRGGFAVQF